MYKYYLTTQAGETLSILMADSLGQAAEDFEVTIKAWFPINRNKIMGAGFAIDNRNKEMSFGIYWEEV